MVALRSDETLCTDLEAYETSCLVGPVQGLLPARTRDQHGSGSVGAAQERTEDVAGLAVDADLLHPVDSTSFIDALDLLEDSLRRHEEADESAADLGLGL